MSPCYSLSIAKAAAMPIASTPFRTSAQDNDFQRLVRDLSDILGPSSGIDSADVNPTDLITRMESYTSVQADWLQYAYKDASMAFTRNLVDRGNGKSNLLVVVWTPGRESVIHDHANAHCIMKVLRGSITETRYEWPTPPASTSTTRDSSPSSMYRGGLHGSLPSTDHMRTTKITTFENDQVTYMADDLGLHKISTAHSDTCAVTLHLYTPPNAANHGCKVFDEKTGDWKLVTGYNFYSSYGRRL